MKKKTKILIYECQARRRLGTTYKGEPDDGVTPKTKLGTRSRNVYINMCVCISHVYKTTKMTNRDPDRSGGALKHRLMAAMKSREKYTRTIVAASVATRLHGGQRVKSSPENRIQCCHL